MIPACRIAANIAKLPELIRQKRSVITPLNPRRRMRTRWRLVLRIRLTIAAEPSRSFHALLKGRETAIRPAARCSLAVNRAPRIILCLGACSNADDGEANSRQEEEQELHGRLPILGFSL